MNTEYIQVIVDAEAHLLPQPLTYRVPEGMRGDVRFGACVLVPLGRGEVIGYVVCTEQVPPPEGHEVRDILAVVQAEPFLNEGQYGLIQWLTRRWRCGMLDALRCLVPPAVSSHVQRVVRLTRPGAVGTKLTARQKDVVQELEGAGGSLPFRELQKAVRNPGRILQALRKAGVVEDAYVVMPPAVRPQVRKGLRLPDGTDLSALLDQAASEKQAAVLRYLGSAGVPVPKADLCRTLGVSGAGSRSAAPPSRSARGTSLRTTSGPRWLLSWRDWPEALRRGT